MTDTSRPQRNAKVSAYNDSFNEDLSAGILRNERGYRYRLVDGLMLPPYVTPARLDLSRNLQLRSTDICFCSYPKSGSTWLSQIILLLANDGSNPTEMNLRQHMIWAESSWPYPRTAAEIDALAERRIFKSHMPNHLALGGEGEPSGARQIYIARNPKDVCASYYHFETGKAWAGGFECDWNEWFELFITGQVQRGNWFDHVLSWWLHEGDDDLLFLTYEDLLLDFDDQVRRLAGFLQIPIDDALLDAVRQQSTFEHMKDSSFADMHEVEQLDSFYRKGEIGSWRNEFSPDQNARFDDLIESRLTPAGLTFNYG